MIKNEMFNSINFFSVFNKKEKKGMCDVFGPISNYNMYHK